MASQQQVLTELISPIVEALECELWGIEILSQGRYSTVRVYIEKKSGVELADCEKVSRQISSVLDVEDPINGQYTLEVSSPGMDRPLFTLDHYERFIGDRVRVKLLRSFDRRKKIQGVLSAVEGDEVVIRVDNEEFLLPIVSIEKANIVPNFDG